MKGNLRLRLTVAAIGVPLCAMVVYGGGGILAAGLGLLAGVAYWEYAAMLRDAGQRPFVASGCAGAAALPPLYWLLGPGGTWGAAAGLLMGYAALALRRVPVERGPMRAAALTAFGVLYIGGLLTFGVPLREAPPLGRGTDLGGEAVDRLAATLVFFYPVAVTWLADTAAYFGGKTFGRRQLAPKLSPNKTVAGAVSALVCGPPVALLYARWALPGSWYPGTGVALVFGLAVAGAAIVGDLVESALKRECGVKDSSGLLPGHGGVLDRLDSVLWALPVGYFLLTRL